MKKILHLFILSYLMSLNSCGCPECFNISEPVRIIYLDEKGDNLLANKSINPQSAVFCDSSLVIPFKIKDYVIKDSKEKVHLEFANELLQDNCVGNDCCIIIRYKNIKPDTLIYRIKKESIRCCTSYAVVKFQYNGKDLLGKTENTIGAYVIIK